MATGKPAWPSAAVAMYNLVSTDAMPPLPDSLTRDGVHFLTLCFQRDPSRRPSASQLLAHRFMEEATDERLFVAGVRDVESKGV